MRPFPLPRHLWEGGPSSLAKVSLTNPLQACAEERKDSRSCSSRNRNPPLQTFYSTRSTHRRQWWVPRHHLHHSLSCWAFQSAKLNLPMPLASWEVEKMSTDKSNKALEPRGLLSHYLFLAFECRSPRNWWGRIRFCSSWCFVLRLNFICETLLPLQISLGNKVGWFWGECLHDYEELGRFPLLHTFHSLNLWESLPEETKVHFLLPGQGGRPRAASVNL